MAIVYGPLHSDNARGKIADALVFLGWKGIKTCRMWLKPANPEDPDQGDIRTIIGGIGRSAGRCLVDMTFDKKLKAKEIIPDQQSKQSYLVQYIKNTWMAGKKTTMISNYNTIRKAATGHALYTTFKAQASAAGFRDFELPYDTISTFPKGLGLYLLAKAGIAFEFTGLPYTIALASWTGTQIKLLVSHLRSK